MRVLIDFFLVNKINFYWQVLHFSPPRGVGNASIHVQGIDKVMRSGNEFGDFWRVLAPGPYVVTVSKKVSVKLTRIISHIFHCIHALYSTHTNNTYRCQKATALVKDVTSNLIGWEAYDCIINVPSLTGGMIIIQRVWQRPLASLTLSEGLRAEPPIYAVTVVLFLLKL